MNTKNSFHDKGTAEPANSADLVQRRLILLFCTQLNQARSPLKRCEWATRSDLEQSYHDNEWGRPIHDDRSLFEFLVLEGAQAGLSWSTILRKREGYRKAFDHFDARKIADTPSVTFPGCSLIPRS